MLGMNGTQLDQTQTGMKLDDGSGLRVAIKHLHRYVGEFASRHNVRDEETIVQMTVLACGLAGKRLR